MNFGTQYIQIKVCQFIVIKVAVKPFSVGKSILD